MINHPNRRRATKTAISDPSANAPKAVTAKSVQHDHNYDALLDSVHRSFAAVTNGGAKLFCTDATGLNAIYLDNLPADQRQFHNCHCCHQFIERYGDLAVIDEDGTTRSAMWNFIGMGEVAQPYIEAFTRLNAAVKRANVISPFLAKESIWGNPVTGPWSHFSVTPPQHLIYKGRVLSASQAIAAAKENFRTVITALQEFSVPLLDEALRVLKSDQLSRNEKFIAPVQWLRHMHNRPQGRIGANMLWRAIADAPEGFCHPRASVIGPLLEDIAAGLPFEEIKARFNAKMHPAVYQRPQAAPSAGNIKAAEDIVQKLGIAPSLERRFARLEELQVIWKPTPARAEKVTSGGVFGHLKPKTQESAIKPVALPITTMTWDKFVRTVLPTAEDISLKVPSFGNFIAVTTAVHFDAPPILKWDREGDRNPFSCYLYVGGSDAGHWNLTAGRWTKVTAISLYPHLWGNQPSTHLGTGAVVVLDGAIDGRKDSGNALFPENMRQELHAIRATIEGYSKKAKMQGRDRGSACGYSFGKGIGNQHLRVTANGGVTEYIIDRLD